MKLLKIFFCYLLVVICLLLFVPNVNAATPTPEPDPCDQIFNSPPAFDGSESDGVEFETYPPAECIDESGKYQNIQATFHGLSAGQGDYVICTGSKDCLKEEGFILGLNGPSKKDGFVGGGSPIKFDADGNANLSIRVCGADKNKVMVDKVGEEKNCPTNSDKNYFWGGNIYFLSVGLLSEKDAYYRPAVRGGFYVARSYPKVEISPNDGITVGTKLTVALSRDTLLKGKDTKKRNNFQIVVEGGEDSYFKDECVSLGSPGTRVTKTFRTDNKPFRVGKYIIKINEQDNEGSRLLRSDHCQGGFTYYHITCTVTNSNAEKKGSCTKPEDGKDPKGQEYRAFLKDLAELTKAGMGYKFPCSNGGDLASKGLNCKIDTAIGAVSITPQGFIESVFKLVLFLATFGGIIIIIYSGYMLMISRGDKEKIAGARETITSAIVGLLFIILSIVILELIGVQILKIPGFGP